MNERHDTLHNTISTEDKILNSAKKIFYQKGLKGARMQEIADDAGVNKAMLHYYFRSKEKLFDKVFEQSINNLSPNLLHVFLEEGDLKDKIAHLVETLIDLFLEEHYLSNFIINELSQNPDKIFNTILANKNQSFGSILPLINSQIQEAIEAGIIKDNLKPAELLINIISLCLLPIMGKSIVQKTLMIDDEHMLRFLEKRKKTISEFVFSAIYK